MSVEAGSEWQYDSLKFHGLSLSGIRTAIAMPEQSLSFDVAQGYPFLLNLKNFFISHGHLDHAAGIPYIISQKSMTRQPTAKFYMPASMVEPMDQIMKLWEKIEDHQYAYEFIPVHHDEKIQLNGQNFIKPFRTQHRVESYGYTFFESHKKLKKEFHHCTQKEIIELRRQQVEIHEVVDTPLVSFTGDTQIEFLESAPWIKKSKVLFLEATYLDEKKTIQNARDWGHTHLDEILPRLQDLECEKIVLIHISSRYSPHEIKRIISAKVPAEFTDRIEIFPGR